MKPFPTIESLQIAQKKHSLCHAKVSKATNFVLPSPPFPLKLKIIIRSIEKEHYEFFPNELFPT